MPSGSGNFNELGTEQVSSVMMGEKIPGRILKKGLKLQVSST